MTVLKLKDVSLCLTPQSQPILKQINYEIKKNDFVILLGSNGSGKSSLLKLIHRQYAPTSGSIELNNQKIASINHHYFANQVAVLTQNSEDSLFSSLTLLENYMLMQNHQNKQTQADIKKYLQKFNPNLANKLNSPVKDLSGGERQALCLALCLLRNPRLLLLDEHTSALDPKTADQIMRLTAHMVIEHKMSCVLTTHDLDIALTYGNRILILKDGSIIKTFEKNTCGEISKSELINYYY